MKDVSRIKIIILAMLNCDVSRTSFEWSFEVNKKEIFKFINKDNLKIDFAEIFDIAEMNDIYDVNERWRHSLETQKMRLSTWMMIEFTITIWRKKSERINCTFHLINVRILKSVKDNFLRKFWSSKKRQKIERWRALRNLEWKRKVILCIIISELKLDLS